MLHRILFLLMLVALIAGCTKTYEPSINRVAESTNERDTFMARAVWFPATFVVSADGSVTAEIDLEKLFQKVSNWLQENEDRISIFSVDVVNATRVSPSSDQGSLTIPSGALITYTLKK